jgi:hypothetical protein
VKIKLKLNLRQFNDVDERRDSGYYNGLSPRKNATIEVNSNDDYFEQVQTLYHEMTHMVLDLVMQYKYDEKKRKFSKRTTELKESWKKHEGSDDLEEQICRKVEAAVQKVLKEELPKEFFKKMFDK